MSSFLLFFDCSLYYFSWALYCNLIYYFQAHIKPRPKYHSTILIIFNYINLLPESVANFYSFLFFSSGNESGTWYVDLKTGPAGSCGVGAPAAKPDVTLSMNDEDFQQMFQGEKIKTFYWSC